MNFFIWGLVKKPPCNWCTLKHGPLLPSSNTKPFSFGVRVECMLGGHCGHGQQPRGVLDGRRWWLGGCRQPTTNCVIELLSEGQPSLELLRCHLGKHSHVLFTCFDRGHCMGPLSGQEVKDKAQRRFLRSKHVGGQPEQLRRRDQCRFDCKRFGDRWRFQRLQN